MRPGLFVLLAFALAIAAPSQAQTDACTEAEPCLWVIDLDASGFSADPDLSGTSGDWFVIEAYNTDDIAHEMEIAALGLVFTAHPFDSDEVDANGNTVTAAFQLDASSDIVLADLTADDQVTITVSDGDIVDEETSSTTDGSTTDSGNDDASGGDSKNEPFPSAAAVGLALLAAVAFVARRR